MATDPQYLSYRKRMISQGKSYLNYKEWKRTRPQTKKKKSSGPCFIGTARRKK